MISPLAYIHPEAKIGENVEIAPFVFIDKNVVIGDNNKIMANANILYGSVTETLYFREPLSGPSRKTLNFAEKNQPLKSETTT